MIRPIDLSLGHIRLFAPEPEAAVRPAGTYGEPAGSASLRALVAENHGVTIDQVAITTGASMAITASLAALPTRGRVLLPRPGFPAYARTAALLGHRPATYDLRQTDEGWAPDLEGLRRGLRRGDGVAVLWNFPHNPTGAQDSPADLAAAAEMAADSGATLITDRVYRSLAGVPAAHQFRPPVPSEVQVHSFSKDAMLAGERLGFVVASPETVSAIVQAHWSLAMSPPAAAQAFASESFSRRIDRGAVLRAKLAEGHRMATEMLGGLRVVDAAPPASGPFLWARIRTDRVTGDQLAGLCAHAGVLVAAGEDFGVTEETWIRVSVAVPPDELREGLRRLRTVLEVVDTADERPSS